MCPKSVKRTSVGIGSARVYSNTYPTHRKKYQKLLLFTASHPLPFTGMSTTHMTSGMEPNSPDSTDTLFPCGNCNSTVTYDHKGLQCETCDKTITGSQFPQNYHPLENPPCLYTSSSYILVVSALGHFGLGRFGLGRFGQILGCVVSALGGGSFRPFLGVSRFGPESTKVYRN